MDWDFPKIKTSNQIAMTREEAIKIVRDIYQTDKEKEALGVLIPELADSEDERIIRELVNFLQSPFIKENLTDEKVAPWIDYLEKLKEQKLVEIEEIIRKAKSEGRQEVIDNPEYYQLQKPEEWQKPDWSDEDKLWLSEVYFAIDHSMYSEVERQAMKNYIDYLRYQSQPKTSWNEEDEKMYAIMNSVIKSNIGDTSLSNYIDRENLFKLKNWFENRLKSIRPQAKPEWSEEDEKNSAFIVAALDAYARLRKEKNNTSGQEDFDKAVSWIHDRLGFIRPQPKHEWSENSRKRLKTIADYLRYKGYEDDAEFIESIPPQQKEEGIKGVKGHPDPAGVWIPSDGQLNALKYFLAQHRLQMDASTTKWEEYDNLRSLYDILCKIAKSYDLGR